MSDQGNGSTGVLKSPPGKLVRFFQTSRDNWKRKYMESKIARKRLQNRVNDVTRSREHWKLKAQDARRSELQLQHEVDALRTQLAAAESKK